MHIAIQNCISNKFNLDYYLLIDGTDFKPYLKLIDNMYYNIPNICVKGGDNRYASIAAASIIAKVERDRYIEDLCKEFPKLNECYNLGNNKGYGTKQHINGINKYGITKYHRKSFNPCSSQSITYLL